MFKCLIVLTSLFSAAVLAAPAWTWVDAEGRRHYSDVPVEGATQIELPDSQTFSSSAARRSSTAPAAAAAPAGAETPAVTYTVLDIVSPSQEETLHNIEGTMTVAVATYPALSTNHRFDVILDGERRQLGSRALEFTLNEVYRGEHTLAILIVDASGREIKRSAPVTFYVRQTSVN